MRIVVDRKEDGRVEKAPQVMDCEVNKLSRRQAMGKYVCDVCGYIYDPAEGDSEGGIPAGTPFEKLPEDWTCPVCGASKEDFSPEE